MSDLISYSKAKHCLSVLATTSTCPIDEARRHVLSLTAESATSGTSPSVQAAEADAFVSIRALLERLKTRQPQSAAREWKKANDAIVRWINSAS